MNNQVKVTEKTEMTENEMKIFILNQLLSEFRLYEDIIAKSEANFLSLVATLSPKLEKLTDINSKEYENLVEKYRQAARLSNEVTAARVLLRDLNKNLMKVADKLNTKNYYHISISSKKDKATSMEALTLSVAGPFEINKEYYRQFIDNSIEVLQDLKSKLGDKEPFNGDSPNFH